MVGLSVVLEAQQHTDDSSSTNTSIRKKSTPQVINKTTMMLSTFNNTPSPSLPPPPLLPEPSSQNLLFQAPTFLDQCFLCSKRLLPGNDIYMYKGERAFCSVDCRCKHIFTDEEEAECALQKGNCSVAVAAAIGPSSSSSTPHHHRQGPTNRW